MSSSILEKIRSTHEDIERYEQSIVETLGENSKIQKEKVTNKQRINFYLDQVQSRCNEAINLYTDKEGLLNNEIENMKQDSLQSFLKKLDDIQKYYTRNPDLEEGPSKLDEYSEELNFTGDEYWGKYIDIHPCYSQYINLPSIKNIDYVDYLSFFYKFDAIPLETKLDYNYSVYIQSLYDYFIHYFKRVQPLFEVERFIQDLIPAFEEKWARGDLVGWDILRPVADVDLSIYDSIEALESLGMEQCKSLVMQLGLKCGGSLKDRANRLWTAKTVSRADLPLNLFATSFKGKKLTINKKPIKSFSDLKYLVQQEFIIQCIVDDLAETIKNSQIYAEKKAVQNYEERLMAERDQEEIEVAIAEDEKKEETYEDTPIYNPKNLPIGLDGKPIPYWLYKEQGLNEKFTCEICGNETYLGRKAYDQHFQKAKHAYGMKCLGIPNTKHFQGISHIQDAIALNEKLKKQAITDDWNQEDEEFEDRDGNIYNKTDYEDLRRNQQL